MKRLLQFFGIGKKAKAKAEPESITTKVITPASQKDDFKHISMPRGKSSVDARWQVKKHRHNTVRAKNRSARRMRTHNKIYA